MCHLANPRAASGMGNWTCARANAPLSSCNPSGKGGTILLQPQDIAIVGCGPGGMAAALFLARAGHRVTIFEQFDAPRPVGSGLLIQPTGQRVLAKLGLLEAIVPLATPVSRLIGWNVANGLRALDMEYAGLGAGKYALGIHRSSLFDVLFAAVHAAAIPILCDKILCDVTVDGDAARPCFADGTTGGRFDLLIDASGANGPLTRGKNHILPYGAYWTSVDVPDGSTILPDALEQRYFAGHKMAGVLPIGRNPATGNPGAALFWSVRIKDAAATRAAGIAPWRAAFCELWPDAAPFVDQVADFDALTLATYRHRTGKAATHRRIIHLGDAWHATSPQLGQGANMALMDALALARAVDTADAVGDIVRLYQYWRQDHVRLYQALSRILTPMYQSDGAILPFFRDRAIHHGARLTGVRRLIARLVSGELGSVG